jgi:hypothetical protein
MKKILALLLLVPVLSFTLLPVLTVTAQTPAPVGIFVECYGYPASVAIVYAGHYEHVSCTGSWVGSDHCFVVNRAMKYSATVSVGGITYTWSGTFTPAQGYLSGHASNEAGFAKWSLDSPDSYGCGG